MGQRKEEFFSSIFPAYACTVERYFLRENMDEMQKQGTIFDFLGEICEKVNLYSIYVQFFSFLRFFSFLSRTYILH